LPADDRQANVMKFAWIWALTGVGLYAASGHVITMVNTTALSIQPKCPQSVRPSRILKLVRRTLPEGVAYTASGPPFML
jgi:hypothetical protein